MNKVICHQFATGRGTTGYGFVAFSKEKETDLNASFSFSLNKNVGLRFSRLPAGTDYVLEIDPVSTDYRYTGAFYTGRRIEAGSSSIYTHVLIFDTEQTDAHNPMGLLKTANFLSPQEFSDITYGKKFLKVEEKEDDPLSGEKNHFTGEQEKILGAFLARYWKLTEQREWSGKSEELALILPGKTIQEMIAFFSGEIVTRLPEQVRPAISVSFGTQWTNRGSNPCVCCVLTDIQDNPYPFYNVTEGSTSTRKAEAVEEKIGQLLMQGDPESLPETYRRICTLGRTDEQFRNMARSYTTIAHCVNADLKTTDDENSAIKKKLTYEKLTELAEKRYGITREKARYAFLPLLLETFRAINESKISQSDEKKWIIQENLDLHLSGMTSGEKLDEHDEAVILAFNSLKLNDMVAVLRDIRTNLKQKGKTTEECLALIGPYEQGLMEKHRDPVYDTNSSVSSALRQCSRLFDEDGEAASSITEGYIQWLCDTTNRDALISTLGEWQNVEKINNTLFFSLLEKIDISGCTREKELISCVNIIRCARRKDPARAETIREKSFPIILNNANKLKPISAEGFGEIADFTLDHTLSQETVMQAVILATDNPKTREAAAYFDRIMEKILSSDISDKPEIQDALFIKLEEAGKCFSTEQYMERLLEKSNNRIPDHLNKCREMVAQRLQKGINSFIHSAGIKSQPEMQREWDQNYAGKYSCPWNQLTESQLKQSVYHEFETLYSESRDKIDFLNTSWTAATMKGESCYGSLLKTNITDLIGKEYDTLWKQEERDPASQEVEDSRSVLDRIVDGCDSQELKVKCESTSAGRARNFLYQLHELDNNGLEPKLVGEMLLKYRRNENYKKYIRINPDFFKSEKTGDENTLIKALFQALSGKYEEDYNYWEAVLGVFGFRFTQGWKDDENFRMLNILSFITQALEKMLVPDLMLDLQAFCQQHGYREHLWNNAIDEKYFCGNGRQLLPESLCKWLEIE